MRKTSIAGGNRPGHGNNNVSNSSFVSRTNTSMSISNNSTRRSNNNASFIHPSSSSLGPSSGPLLKEAKDFVEKLKHCGYRDSLSHEELDWVFSYPETRPLIRFLSGRLSKDMVLSEDQVREYRILEKQGKVLSGTELEEAYQSKLDSDRYHAASSSSVEDQEASNEELQQILEQMSGELKQLEMQYERKKMQRDQLLSVTAAQQQTFDLDQKLKLKQEERLRIENNLAAKNRQMNDSLDKIQKLVQLILGMYSKARSTMLCECNLTRYFQEDKMFCERLNAFINKQIEIKEAVRASKLEKTRTPTQQAEYEKNTRELSRLQSTFAKSEEQYMSSLVKNQKVEAQLKMVEAFQSRFDGYYQHLTEQTIIDRIQSIESQTKTITEQLEQYLKRDVPQLFSELTSLYTLPVLEADYDFKIARQDYELSKHDQVLYYLFRQKSRNEFLRLGFDSEMKRLQETFFIINALKAELNSMSEELLKRITSYEEYVSKPHETTQEKETDIILKTAISLAQSESEKVLEISSSFDALVSNMTTIEESFQHNISTVHQMHNILNNMIQRMTDRSEELERAAFHDELAKNNQMSISSEQIQTGLQSLQISTDSLGERMKTMLQVKTEREAHLNLKSISQRASIDPLLNSTHLNL